METQEAMVYRDIQKSAGRMVKMLDLMSDKVYDKELALQITRQSVKISQIMNQAQQELIGAKAQDYRNNLFEDLLQLGGLQWNTLLNTSTGHIARLLIENTTKGMLDMERTLRHHGDVGEKCSDLAKKLMEVEEKNIAQLKDYL